jgi:hypothetical protein
MESWIDNVEIMRDDWYGMNTQIFMHNDDGEYVIAFVISLTTSCTHVSSLGRFNFQFLHNPFTPQTIKLENNILIYASIFF